VWISWIISLYHCVTEWATRTYYIHTEEAKFFLISTTSVFLFVTFKNKLIDDIHKETEGVFFLLNNENWRNVACVSEWDAWCYVNMPVWQNKDKAEEESRQGCMHEPTYSLRRWLVTTRKSERREYEIEIGPVVIATNLTSTTYSTDWLFCRPSDLDLGGSGQFSTDSHTIKPCSFHLFFPASPCLIQLGIGWEWFSTAGYWSLAASDGRTGVHAAGW
jgi:hypothetical protein